MSKWGVDIASHGRLDSRGQVSIVAEEKNVEQALRNRLLTEKDTYSECCDDYGSNLHEMLKRDRTDFNIEMIKWEIRNEVLKDPRIASCEVYYIEGKFRYTYKLFDNPEEYSSEVE